MGRIATIGTVVAVLFALIVLPQIFYTVDETQMAIVTRFGEFKEAHTSPGIRTKWPFVYRVTKFDKRLLRVDAQPASLLTSDKRNLVIDAYARYRIVDPLLFFQRLTSEVEAESRVANIVNSQIRSEVALDLQTDVISETREEIMRRVTTASNRFEVSRERAMTELPDGLRDSRITVVLTKAVQDPNAPERGQVATPEQIEALIREPNPPELDGLRAQYFVPLINQLGIEIVDVRMKRADFPPAIAQSVFDRMKAERDRIASGLRAEGEQRDLEIRADVDRQATITLQTAEGFAAQVRGEGESEAIKILAAALEEDPAFYDFQRTLEAYKNTLDADTTLVLDANSDFFKFLQDSTGTLSTQTP
jgi:membrane protease subunit HflC